ncbi:MAG: Hpt domain-containing protein [Bacteroidota bacterium]
MKVNLDYLKSLVGNDPETIREMLNIFCEDVPRYLQSMQESQDANDWPGVARTAHSLKSSMGFTGRNDMVDMAEELQHQKEEPTDPAMIALLETFKQQAYEIVEEFKGMMQRSDF